MAVQALSQEQITDAYIRQRALQLQEQARQREAEVAAAAQREATRSRTWAETGKDAALGLSQGLMGLGAAAYGVANAPFAGLNTLSGGLIPTPEQLTGGAGSQFFQDWNQAMEEGKSAPLQARKAAQEAAFDRGIGAGILETISSGQLLGDLAAQAIPSLIPGTAAARVAGTAGRADAAARGLSVAAQAEQARRAATTAATITTGAQVGGNTYTEVVSAAAKDGASPYEANARALGAATLAGLGSAGIMRLTGAGALEAGLARAMSGGAATPVTGGIVRATATGAGREAGEEAAQSALEQEAQNIFVESRTLGQDTGKAAALGGIAGGILGGGIGGLSRALNGGQPSLTREQMAEQKAAVDAELNGVLRPSVLGGASQQAGQSAEYQAELAAARERAELAAARPTVEQTTDEDVAALRQAFGDQEINLDEAGLPLEGALPEVQELTGARRVMAERQMRLAQQPPRMGVVELPIEDVTVTETPTRNVPSAVEAYRQSAPLTGVEQRFGAEAAKAEAERRGVDNLRDEEIAKYFGFAELGRVQARRRAATPTQVPGGGAVRQPIDVSTKQARAKFAGQVRTELRKEVPSNVADKVQGAYVNALADLAAADGIQPGTPEFAAFVGRKAYRDMAIANRAGKTKSAEAAQASRLSAAFPIDTQEAANIDAGLDFDALVEQEVAPATEPAPTVEQTADVLVPAADVAAFKQGQVWVDPQGARYTATSVPNKTTAVLRGEDGKGAARQLSRLKKEGWSLVGQPQVEGLDAGMLSNLRDTLAGTYWQERGGRLLRENGQEGTVTGRTEWLSSVPEVQAVLSNTGYSAADVAALLDRAATGQGRPLTDKQKGLVQGVMDALNDAENTTPPVDAQSKADESLTPQRYDQARWELYNQYPGAAQLNGLAEAKAAEGNPQPVYAAMAFAIDLAADITELNTAAFAAKAHPEYDLMSDQLRTDIEARVATAVNRITGAAFNVKADKTTANQGEQVGVGTVAKVVFDKTVADMASKLGIDIRAYDTAAELEAAVGHAVPANVKGMYSSDGVVHIVRANHTSRNDLAFTIAHERGHKGLAMLLGQNLRAATMRMWANPEMRKRIKTKMAELNYAQDTEEARRASRTLAAEEVLADMLASGEKLNNSITAKLRSGVRNFFATVLGYRDMVVTNAEVDRLLQDVAQVLQGQPAQNVTVGGADADLWLNNTEQAVENNPKFNVAQADLDQLVLDATQETPAKIVSLNSVTKAAAKASIDAAKAVGEKIKGNSLGELYVNNAMHLSQLEGWFDKLFEGRIGKLATLKRAKEAFFNQMNSRPIDLKYNGESIGAESVNEIAKNWSKFGRQNPQKMQALNATTSYATFYKVFPDRTWEQQNDIDYDAAGFTVEQRQAAHRQMQALWRSIGAEGQAIYKQAQAVYAHRWKQRFAVLDAELDRIGKSYTVERTNADGTVDTLTRYKNDIRLAMQRVSEGPYSPLQRNGEFIVTARDADGDVVHFSAYDTKAEAELARKHVRESMERTGEGGVVAVTTQKQFDVSVNGTSRGTIEQMSNKVKADLMGALPAEMSDADKRQVINSVSAGLVESYLQALPQNSFMKHARKRKNVEGFSTDAFRAFNDYALRSARDTAGIKFDGQIGNAMTQVQNYAKDVTDGKYLPEGVEGVQEVDATKLQQVANAVQSQHAASLDVNRNAFVRTMTQAGFIYYMTSLSQMFLNATQTYMVAFPRLASQYGAGFAVKELNKAVGEYFRSGFDLLGDKSKIDDPRVKAALQSLYESGTLDFTQAHDLSEMAAGNNETLSPVVSAGVQLLSYAMHKSEVFNRQVTATAAIRMELAKRGNPTPRPGSPEAAQLQEEMAEVGRKAVDTTHFDYSQSNKPPIMQSNLGALALQFQQYRFHMLSMIGKDIRDGFFGTDPAVKSEARKALGWLLGMQLAFTGAAGTILAPIAFAIADAFKDDDDLTDSRQDFINYFGKYVSHGVLAGMIDTQRIGADTLIPILGERAYEPITDRQSDIFMYHIQQNLGPAVGLVGDAFDGVSHLINGDVYKASQELLPKPFKDATKAVYEGVNGAADARGVVYNQPSLFSGLSQAVGLRSGERRDAEAVRGAAFKANARYYAAKQRNLNKLALGYALGDNDLIADAQAGISDFNTKYPDMAIRGQEMRQAIVNRFRSQQVAEEYGFVAGRPPRDSILAATGR
jgi:hypothetical protein